MYHKYFFWFDSRHTTPKIIKNFVNLFYWLTSQVNCFPLWICSFFNFKIKITFWKTIYSFNIFVTTVLLQSLDFSVLENFCEINSRVQAGLGAGTLHFHNKPMRLLFRVRPEKWLFMSCFIFELSDLNIDALFIIYIYIYKFIYIYKCLIYNIYIKFPKNLLLYKIVSSNVIGARMQKLHSSFFFLYAFSFANTDDWKDSRGRKEAIFIPLYHFHSLKNIQTSICSFESEMTTAYFYSEQM